jgi:hypothetical protein
MSDLSRFAIPRRRISREISMAALHQQWQCVSHFDWHWSWIIGTILGTFVFLAIQRVTMFLQYGERSFM